MAQGRQRRGLAKSSEKLYAVPMVVRRVASLLTVALLLVLTGGPTVDAQDVDALRFFQLNQARPFFRAQPDARRPTQPAAVPRARRIEPEERSYVAPRRRVLPPVETEAPVVAQPERPVVPVTTFVYVLGDSLAELLAQGLKDQIAESKPDVGVVRRGRSSSGLVRDDYHDWNKVLRELLAGTEKVDLVVMMLGSNDRQALRDDTGSHEFNTERWREIYIRRLDDLLNQARDKRLPFILVGMPLMQSQRLSADMLTLNAMFRERAQRSGAAYVDVWEGFANEQGAYSSIGPDVNGEMVRLRTVDGVHFTRAGMRKLGFFVGKELDQQLGRVRPNVEVASLPSDLSEQIRRDAPSLVPQGLQSVPLPSELPAVPVIGERPLSGPIIALTNPPESAGGRMLSGRITQPSNEMAILVEQALGYGRLPPAKNGRADDFRWPKVN
jgi:uncharacterized protein